MACYADQLGNCAGRLTLEHWVSRSVLDLGGTRLLVNGLLPRQQRTKRIGAGALASRILCKKHNGELSSIDAAGTTFVSGLHASYKELDNSQFRERVIEIPGRLLELWLLKVFCGHLAVHRIAAIPPALVEILFGKRAWPEGEGLYVLMPEDGGNAAWRFQLVRVELVFNESHTRIVGAKFGLGGFALLLAFGKPRAGTGVDALNRPGAIVLEREGKAHRYGFSWDDNGKHGTMHCTLLHKIDGEGVPPVRYLV